MNAAGYSALLRDPRWQRRRLEILSRSDFTCEQCHAADKHLNVHHKQYRNGAKPWEYEDDELIALCEDCHLAEHIQAELTPYESLINEALDVMLAAATPEERRARGSHFTALIRERNSRRSLREIKRLERLRELRA